MLKQYIVYFWMFEDFIQVETYHMNCSAADFFSPNMIPWFIKLSVLIWIAVATHFVCCVVCHYMKIPPFIHSVYCPKILVLFQVLYWQCCCNISCASAFVHIHKYFLGCTPTELVGSKVCTTSTSPCNAIVFQSSCRCDSIALEFGGFSSVQFLSHVRLFVTP